LPRTGGAPQRAVCNHRATLRVLSMPRRDCRSPLGVRNLIVKEHRHTDNRNGGCHVSLHFVGYAGSLTACCLTIVSVGTDQFIAARVSSETKLRLRVLAEQQQVSESPLLKRPLEMTFHSVDDVGAQGVGS
jgi:hypothetical protein